MALFILQQATALRSKALGNSHHKTADAQFQLAEVWRTRNSPESSLQLHLQAYDTRRKIFGACHSLVAESQHAIGRLKFESAQFAEVRALFSVVARLVLVQAALVSNTLPSFTVPLAGSSLAPKRLRNTAGRVLWATTKCITDGKFVDNRVVAVGFGSFATHEQGPSDSQRSLLTGCYNMPQHVGDCLEFKHRRNRQN